MPRPARRIAKITFEVPGVPRELVQAVGVQLTRDGSRAYVALGPSNRVAKVDAKSFKVLRTYLVTGAKAWAAEVLVRQSS